METPTNIFDQPNFLTGLKSGSLTAFKVLESELFPKFRSYIIHAYGLPVEDAKDIVLVVANNVIQKIDQYDAERGTFIQWSFGILRYACRDWLKKQHKILSYEITTGTISELLLEGLPEKALLSISELKDVDFKNKTSFIKALKSKLGKELFDVFASQILKRSTKRVLSVSLDNMVIEDDVFITDKLDDSISLLEKFDKNDNRVIAFNHLIPRYRQILNLCMKDNSPEKIKNIMSMPNINVVYKTKSKAIESLKQKYQQLQRADEFYGTVDVQIPKDYLSLNNPFSFNLHVKQAFLEQDTFHQKFLEAWFKGMEENKILEQLVPGKPIDFIEIKQPALYALEKGLKEIRRIQLFIENLKKELAHTSLSSKPQTIPNGVVVRAVKKLNQREQKILKTWLINSLNHPNNNESKSNSRDSFVNTDTSINTVLTTDLTSLVQAVCITNTRPDQNFINESQRDHGDDLLQSKLNKG